MGNTAEKPCCQATVDRWRLRVERYYTAFPVIKSVKCDTCPTVLQIRFYDKPGPDDESQTTPE
jgi:hypothetical protein